MIPVNRAPTFTRLAAAREDRQRKAAEAFDSARVAFDVHRLDCPVMVATNGDWCDECRSLNWAVHAARLAVGDADRE